MFSILISYTEVNNPTNMAVFNNECYTEEDYLLHYKQLGQVSQNYK